MTDSRVETLKRTLAGALDEDFAALQMLEVERPYRSADCDAILARARRADQRVATITRYDLAARPTCGLRLPASASVRAALTAIARPQAARFPRIVVQDGRGIALLLRDNGVSGDGGVLIARIPDRRLPTLIESDDILADETLLLVGGGTTLAQWGSSSDRAAARMSAPPKADRVNEGGRTRDVVIARPFGEEGPMLVLLRTRPPVRLAQAASIALPLVMVLAALGIAGLAVRYLVVVPLRRLRAVVDAYAAGVPVAASGVAYRSAELTALADAFDRMAARVADHEGAREAALSEQRRLTREVHHRVKNNLQIVSSLLSLHGREAKTPEAADAYQTIQQRVSALALVHRWMNDAVGDRGIDLRPLTGELATSLSSAQLAAGRRVLVEVDSEPLAVTQDTAVPIAFLMTEFAMAIAASEGDTARLRLSFTRTDATHGAFCAKSSEFGGGDAYRTGRDPSARIIQGLARQLRSKLDYSDSDTCYHIAFPVLAS